MLVPAQGRGARRERPPSAAGAIPSHCCSLKRMYFYTESKESGRIYSQTASTITARSGRLYALVQSLQF